MRHLPKIVAIERLGDDEAAVEISDGEHACIVFCHPCAPELGSAVSSPIHALEHGQIQRSDQTIGIGRQTGRKFSHWVVAQVDDAKSGRARVGEIVIYGLRFPGDINVGDVVEFAVDRLDLD